MQRSQRDGKTSGRRAGIIRLFRLLRGEVPAGYSNNKSGLIFNQVDDVSFHGITVINSQTWTLCMNDCEGVSVKDCMFCLSGIRGRRMLSDCKNAIVEIVSSARGTTL
ncbi:MAG: hypothetical protein ACLRSW_06620 [Christensenellaceae bacterium]